MAMYRLYYVPTARTRPGKAGEAAKWWAEKGQSFFEGLPGVKSLQTFAVQFGLGGEFGLEFWYELEDYAVMDRWDQDMAARSAEYGPVFKEFFDLFESGPGRLMGDWPESRIVE